MQPSQQLNRHLRLKPLAAALTLALAIGSVTLPPSVLATDQETATRAVISWQTLRARTPNKHARLIRSRRSGDGPTLRKQSAGEAEATAWRAKMLARHPEMKTRVETWQAHHPGDTARGAIITGTSVPTSTGSQGTTAVLPVTNCNEADLRSAISGATDGDTIDLTGLSNCTITLTSGAVGVSQDSLTIQGPGADNLTINANHDSSVVTFGGSDKLTVTGATLTGGFNYGYQGGAIAGVGSITLEDVVITDSGTFGSYVAGAGVFSSLGDISLTDTIVTGTTSVGYNAGAAVFADNGQVDLVDSTITNNRVNAYYYAIGGGVAASDYAYSQKSTISGNQVTGNIALGAGIAGESVWAIETVISDNSASGQRVAIGGGIQSYGTIAIQSTIANNTARATGYYAGGGGIYAIYEVALASATISGNTAVAESSHDGAQGGGIFVYYGQNSASVSAKYSTISNNSSSGIGGGIVSPYGVKLTNSTISGNHATAGGGAVVYDGETVIQNSTITNNSSEQAEGGGIVSLGQPPMLQSSIIFGNLATAGSADLYSFTSPDATSANNIIGDAGTLDLPGDTITSNPLLGPLQDNGGMTRTHAIAPGSPAIDAGNNTESWSFDQRGASFARVVGAAADIGAFEYDDDIIFANGFD